MGFNPQSMRNTYIEPHISLISKSLFVLFLIGALVFIPFWANAQSNAPAIIRDTEIEETFRGWMEPLLKSAKLGEESVNFVLVQSDDVNAFVAGGANVFFYSGLIDKTENPGEVIGVLAHELGHIAGGHLVGMRGAFERASYQSILGMVLGIGAAIATGDGRAASAIISGTSHVAGRNFLSHSRVNESAADQAAFKYMADAGINPSGLSSFFEKLKGQEYVPASRQVEYVRTHPLTDNRIRAMDALIEKSDLSDKPYPPEWYEQHARMKAKLVGFIHPQKVAWTYDDRDLSIPAQYARAIAAYRQNEISRALSLIDALIEAEPQNPYFHELKGQMLVDFGRVEQSLPSYKTSVSLAPEAGLIRIALAHALIETSDGSQDLNQAIQNLQLALKTEKRSTRAHRLLATAYGRSGRDALAKYHLAEEAVLQRRLPYARRQAEDALKSFDNGSPEWLKAKDLLNHIGNLEDMAQ